MTHVLKYFRTEEEPKAALPKNFIGGFLAVSATLIGWGKVQSANEVTGT